MDHFVHCNIQATVYCIHALDHVAFRVVQHNNTKSFRHYVHYTDYKSTRHILLIVLISSFSQNKRFEGWTNLP